MRVTSLWSGVDDDGRYVMRTDITRSTDEELKDKLRRFLVSGTAVLVAPGRQDDALDPSRPPRVPISYSTDGEWIWPGSLRYYLDEHDLLPEPDFLRHAEAHGFEPMTPSTAQLEEAEEILLGAS